MARARNIKPGFFDNPELGKLNGDIRLLIISLWQLADREGVLEYHPAIIKRYTFGYRDDVTEEDVNRYITVIERLDNNQVLSIINYRQKQYIIITDFEEEQSPHHTEKKGRLPTRKDLLAAGSGELTVITPLDHGYTFPDSGFLIPDSSNKREATASPKDAVVVDLSLLDDELFSQECKALYAGIPDFEAEWQTMKRWFADRRTVPKRPSVCNWLNRKHQEFSQRENHEKAIGNNGPNVGEIALSGGGQTARRGDKKTWRSTADDICREIDQGVF